MYLLVQYDEDFNCDLAADDFTIASQDLNLRVFYFKYSSEGTQQQNDDMA